MKKSNLFFLSFFTCLFSYAQKPVWAERIGGTTSDAGNTIAVDAAGNVFVAGSFQGTNVDFDPGPGTMLLSSNGQDDIFFAKYTSNGNFIWAKSMGGTFSDYPMSICLDANSNVYLIGDFQGTNIDFDPGGSVANVSSNGADDCFFAKYDMNGNYVWAKNIGDGGTDRGNAIGVDGAGHIYITGYISGSNIDFDLGAGVANLTAVGSTDIFIAKYDSLVNYIWAYKIGSPLTDQGYSINVESNGKFYLAGYFSGVNVDFDPGAGTTLLSNNGLADIFLSKYDSSCNSTWAKSMGSANTDVAYSIAHDAPGNVFVTGYFQGTNVDFDPGAGIANLSSAGNQDIFITKFDMNGNYLWAKSIGGATADYGNAVALDAANIVYVTGSFQGLNIDFDAGAGMANLSSAGADDIYCAKYDANGNYIWAKNVGGTGADYGTCVVMDATGYSYFTGSFQNTADFNPGGGKINLTSAGSDDIFIAKYCPTTLTGTVNYSLGTVNNGFAKLYHNIYGKHMEFLDSVQINTSGQFTFYDVYDDSLQVYVRSNTIKTIGTYYGDTCEWIPGDSNIVLCGMNSVSITVDEFNPMAGSGVVSGKIQQGLAYVRMSTVGSPIGGVDVGVRKKPTGTIVAVTQTDALGNYSFNNLIPANYSIYVDIPGLPMDSTYDFTITGSDTVAQLDFIADSASIYITGTTTGIKNYQGQNNFVKIFPNPTSGILYVSSLPTFQHSGSYPPKLFSEGGIPSKITVTNLLGEKLFGSILPDEGQTKIDLGFLQNGIYILSISDGNYFCKQRIIISK